MAKLILSLNGTVINQYFVDKPCITVGRDPGNDIVIDDPRLSRQHARILTVGNDQIAEDLQSSNGTLINGRPLTRQILQHSDVLEFGGHHLRYMSTRNAAEVDLERTMIIKGLSHMADIAEMAAQAAPPVAVGPSARPAKVRLPEGHIKVLASPGQPAIGEVIRLDRVVATVGIPGEQLLVIARRPQGYVLSHVEGPQCPRVNRQSIGSAGRLLQQGDLIEMAEWRLEFRLEPFGATTAGESGAA